MGGNLHPHRCLTLIGITSTLTFLILISSSPSASSSSSTATLTSKTQQTTIEWDLQVNVTKSYFHSIGMCKGTTVDQTRKTGFIGGDLGSIWRTLDGVNWNKVIQFPYSAYWYGIYCFPDAQRVIAVGFSNGDSVIPNGAMIAWSFDGGETWTDRQPMPEAGDTTWLQSVHFYNDTHGITLPAFQETGNYLAYYTTNGGKTASDWIPVRPDDLIYWYQSHPIWVFGDVTKTLAKDYYTGPKLCSSDDAGKTWPHCHEMNQKVAIGSFVTASDAIGVDERQNVYSTTDGGLEWNTVSAIPRDLANKLVLPLDMLWIPNSDVAILVGGNNYPEYVGALVHSTDRGVTWVESIPGFPTAMFYSLDYVMVSETVAEVWVVGRTGSNNLILHATVNIA